LSTLGGTVNVLSDGTSPYPGGAAVTLVAIPDAGYHFVQWTGDVEDVDDVTSLTITITMNAAREVTANFALTSCSLAVGSTDGGEVTTPGEGTFTYSASTVVDLVATPAIGYRFVNWTGNVVTIANVNAASTTITMQGNYIITANFRAQYDLMIDSTDGGGVITPSEGTFTYDAGKVVDLVAEAEEGYYFVQWTGNVSAIANVYAATTTITMNGDYSITANFEQIPPEQFSLTISSTAGGSVTTPGNGVFACDAGATVNLAAEADEGYRFLKWTGNVDTIAGVEDAITTITMNGDYFITANFEQIPPGQFSLTISSTAGGSVTIPGNGIFACDAGATVNLAAEADEGYRFLKWTGNVSTISDVNAATTTIIMNGDYSITASFIAQYGLTIDSTDGGEVIIPGEGTFTYDAGTVLSLVAEAGESYHFARWTGNVDTIADVEDAITTVTINDDYTITANFALPIWDWYDLDAIRDNLGGSYVLMNDLDSTTAGYTELASAKANHRKGWQPIGTTAEGAKFAGSFDGQGHEICGLFIDRLAKSNVGLFGVVGEGGVIENVGLMDVTVTGCSGVGGLVGKNEGLISSSYCTGRVIGYSVVGGLAGYNSGNISNSYCTGRVTGSWWVGGLAGHNSGNISNSYCAGRVTGGWWVGGLAGHNSGNVSGSYCTGIVTGGWWVGGLAGHNSGNVNNSYCTGRVTGCGSVGGLVGKNEGPVNNSYSSGSVTGNTWVGGLTGYNNGNVSNSYCTGIVTGNSDVGGLVGWNEGAVNNSYSTGSVIGNKRVGGLVGHNIGAVGNSFWDTQTSGRATSSGGIGKTTAEMMDIDTFISVGWDIIAVGGSGERNPMYIWNIVDDVTYPFLSWQPI
jgi:hypothetical protein